MPCLYWRCDSHLDAVWTGILGNAFRHNVFKLLRNVLLLGVDTLFQHHKGIHP